MQKISPERILIEKLLAQGGESAIHVLVEEAKENEVADQVLRDKFISGINNKIKVKDLIDKINQDPARDALLQRPLNWFIDLEQELARAEKGQPARTRQRSTTESIDRVKAIILHYIDENSHLEFKKSQIIDELSLERARAETALKQLKAEKKILVKGERAGTLYFSVMANHSD